MSIRRTEFSETPISSAILFRSLYLSSGIRKPVWILSFIFFTSFPYRSESLCPPAEHERRVLVCISHRGNHKRKHEKVNFIFRNLGFWGFSFFSPPMRSGWFSCSHAYISLTSFLSYVWGRLSYSGAVFKPNPFHFSCSM